MFPMTTVSSRFAAISANRRSSAVSVGFLLLMSLRGKKRVRWRGIFLSTEAIQAESAAISSSPSFSPGTMRVVSSTWALERSVYPGV